MEKYIRDKWEKKLFTEQAHFTQEPLSLTSQEEEDLKASSQEDLVPTPTLSSTDSSFIVSSPVVAPLAGRVTEHTTNPFATNSPTTVKSHNPFANTSLPYFGKLCKLVDSLLGKKKTNYGFCKLVTQTTANPQHVINSNNPFLQQQNQQHYSTNNPFLQQQGNPF
jgi:hypothetical protein